MLSFHFTVRSATNWLVHGSLFIMRLENQGMFFWPSSVLRVQPASIKKTTANA